jgi:DNA-binding GntR family transcriptional regulator
MKDPQPGRASSLPAALSRLAPAAPRNAVGDVHRRLRQLILSNELPAGTDVNQLQIARALGISRGPIREAIRMLQEEGLVTAAPNRRSRVTPIDPADVDSAYAERVLLEVLGIRLTVPTLQGADLERADWLRIRMPSARDPEEYRALHRSFHHLLVSRLPEPLLAVAAKLFDRTDRYRRFYASHTPDPAGVALQDHLEIVEAARRSDGRLAGELLARHYARTALQVLAVLCPEYEPRALREALQLAGREA